MNERATLHFRLLGIPVSIYPVSWVILFLLGGGLRMESADQFSDALLFMVAGMLCLLVHEMGHALTGRRLTGCLPSIDIAGMGGLTYTPRLPRTRAGYFLLVAAGPLASLLLGVVAGALFGLHIGHVAAGIRLALTLPLGIEQPMETLMLLQQANLPTLLLVFYLQLFTVCVWWTLFNLLPIYPLDGGKMLGTLLGNNRAACCIGFGVCLLLLAAVTSWAIFSHGSLFNVFIVGYLAYINYQGLRNQR